jgi:hypothetical protein
MASKPIRKRRRAPRKAKKKGLRSWLSETENVVKALVAIAAVMLFLVVKYQEMEAAKVQAKENTEAIESLKVGNKTSADDTKTAMDNLAEAITHVNDDIHGHVANANEQFIKQNKWHDEHDEADDDHHEREEEDD